MVNGLALRSAVVADAAGIATVMRSSMASHDWMPTLYTPDEDFGFVRDVMMREQDVIVAISGGGIVGFIATQGDWIGQLYVRPDRFGQGIGAALLDAGASDMPIVQLYCFQANFGARRFYERHGFIADTLSDGTRNEEGLPDILYVRR
jgi:ribosomal protein S18 acetylase RimI-like enzyme